ncbi:hypothetical protein [Halomicrobium katesii]|uniref:hypothetical protein n=1 Tax=Halomicrobium katesii TaxID=437163 RepID=UPI0012BAB010|nr:hypothetical protein [Halomicrobium katesii]
MSTFDYQTQTKTAVIRIIQRNRGNETAIFTLPESERSYAMVDFEGGGSKYISTTNNEMETASTSNSEQKVVGTVDPAKLDDQKLKDPKQKDNTDTGSVSTNDVEDCEYMHTSSYCTSRECQSINENCWSTLPCITSLHEREDMRIYDCEDTNRGEMYNTVCTNECCEDKGPGCSCSSFGCSAQ